MSIQTSTKSDFLRKTSYHVSLKESSIGFGIKQNKKIKKTKNGAEYLDFFFLSILPKPAMEDKEHKGYIKSKDKNKNDIFVPIMPEFHLPLFNKWVSFLTILAQAYNGEFGEDTPEGEGFLSQKYTIFSSEKGGAVKYELYAFADEKNQAKIVISIEKSERKEGGKILGKYRQPIFKKYLHEMITIAQQTAYELDDYKYETTKKKKDVMSLEYKGLNKTSEVDSKEEVHFGIEKINNEEVKIGIFKNKKTTSLDYNDIFLLNSSCWYRILHKEWLPFIGEKIAISKDGYLTTMEAEINLEENNKGIYHAWQYFFGTAIK